MRAFILAAAMVVAAHSSWAESPPAPPTPVCGPVPLIAEMLLESHGEEEVAHQMTEGGHILTAYVDHNDGSWTILAHDMVRGCIIQGGYADTLPESLREFVWGDA